MTRVIWGALGEHRYETGADRGVLYPANGIGIAWDGLISVSESPTGGDPQPYYVDGFKYINLDAAEEFEATLDAFSSPSEFAPCDGSSEIYPGLFITQQPRKLFGLTYRSLIGNDVDGEDHGYKLHLVYNALAAPASRNNSTIGDSPDPIKLSWRITTNPPTLAGYRPSAHLVIDTSKTPSGLVTAIEDILYGIPFFNPRQPSQQEVLSMFMNWGTPA